MDFTYVVQDFLLEQLEASEIQNFERLDRAIQWTVTDKEVEFIKTKNAGLPCFEVGGLYFLTSG